MTTTLTQEVESVNLGWRQGDAVSFAFRFVGLAALAAHSWTAEVRRGQSRDSTLLVAFDVNATANGEDAVVMIGLTPEANAQQHAPLWWDLQSDDGSGAVRTWIGGRVLLTPDVTV